MNKTALALMLAGVFALSAPLRAEDDHEEEASETAEPTAATPAATPDASPHALNKGYKAEAAATAPVTNTEVAAPAVLRDEPQSWITAPPQRPLGAVVGRAAGGGGGTASGSGAGISCEDSVPKLRNVIRQVHVNLFRYTNRVYLFELGPNEAISVEFTAPKSGGGGFHTNYGTNAREVSLVQSLSETPCDFNLKKALAARQVGPNEPRPTISPCHVFSINAASGLGFVIEGTALTPGTNASAASTLCVLKPGKTYYYNIRTIRIEPNRAPFDDCAADAEIMGSDLKCGGLWQFIGGDAEGMKPGFSPRQDRWGGSCPVGSKIANGKVYCL